MAVCGTILKQKRDRKTNEKEFTGYIYYRFLDCGTKDGWQHDKLLRIRPLIIEAENFQTRKIKNSKKPTVY